MSMRIEGVVLSNRLELLLCKEEVLLKYLSPFFFNLWRKSGKNEEKEGESANVNETTTIPIVRVGNIIRYYN